MTKKEPNGGPFIGCRLLKGNYIIYRNKIPFKVITMQLIEEKK